MTISIERRAAGVHGRYVARVEGREGEAQLVFTRLGPELIRADHTEAPDTLRGSGAARALVTHMVDDARANGFRIVARCPYVQAEAKKHPEWADVFAPPEG